MKHLTRLDWTLIGLFLALKIAFWGAFFFERITGHPPLFGFVTPAAAYQITAKQEHIICRSQDDLRLLPMIRDDRARLFEILASGRCTILGKGETVDKIDGNGWFDDHVEVLRAKDGQRWWTSIAIVKDTE